MGNAEPGEEGEVGAAAPRYHQRPATGSRQLEQPPPPPPPRQLLHLQKGRRCPRGPSCTTFLESGLCTRISIWSWFCLSSVFFTSKFLRANRATRYGETMVISQLPLSIHPAPCPRCQGGGRMREVRTPTLAVGTVLPPHPRRNTAASPGRSVLASLTQLVNGGARMQTRPA